MLWTNGAATNIIDLSSIHPGILAPSVFVFLVITLWFYKCCMMVLFQDKIIYMPGVPPFSRGEKIADYERECRPIRWREERIRSIDGTRISLCVGKRDVDAEKLKSTVFAKRVVILYFQGNASSLPPRLPGLSRVLKLVDPTIECTLIALSYRGYWTSRGRASQRGIELDAAAALAWVQEQHNQPDIDIILWGQSIGAGVATVLAARHLQNSDATAGSSTNIAGLILETPFVSIRDMLATMYPEKWLPYRYLYPFLWNHWDSETALRSIATSQHGYNISVLMLPAAKDEVVPAEQAARLFHVARGLGLNIERKDVPGALHTEVMAKPEGRKAVAHFINGVGSNVWEE